MDGLWRNAFLSIGLALAPAVIAAQAVALAGTQEGPSAGSAAKPQPPSGTAQEPSGAEALFGTGEGALFPKLASRDPIAVASDFGKSLPVWAEADAAARELAGLQTEDMGAVFGTVDGEPVTFGQVLDEAVLRFGEKFMEEYLYDLILVAEIRDAEVEVSPKDLELGEAEMWTRLRQKGVNNEAQLRTMFKWTPEFVRRKAYIEQGGKKLFASDMGTEDPDDTEAFFMQVWMTELVGRYDIVTRYRAEGVDLPEGVLARVGDREMRGSGVAPFLVPNLRPFHYEMAFESLARKRVLDATLAALDVEVPSEEIEDRIAQERAKYANSLFDYETMLQISETNIVMERRKFRAWLAYDKLFGAPTEEEIRKHFDENPVFFRRGAVAAAEIKTLAYDPKTGEPKGENPWEGAKERILEAMGALRTGTPFSQAVMRYSEDPKTKKWENATLFGGTKQRVAGSIGIFPIKDGRMSNELASAAFLCPKGEWIGPIRGREGYHLLQVVDVKAPRELPYDEEPYTDVNENGRFDMGEPFADLNKNGNWNGGQRDNAIDDFQSDRVGRWLDGYVRKTKIERAGQ